MGIPKRLLTALPVCITGIKETVVGEGRVRRMRDYKYSYMTMAEAKRTNGVHL